MARIRFRTVAERRCDSEVCQSSEPVALYAFRTDSRSFASSARYTRVTAAASSGSTASPFVSTRAGPGWASTAGATTGAITGAGTTGAVAAVGATGAVPRTTSTTAVVAVSTSANTAEATTTLSRAAAERDRHGGVDGATTGIGIVRSEAPANGRAGVIVCTSYPRTVAD